MAGLKAFKPGLKLLSNHRILSWSLAKETANKTTRNSIPSTKHCVEVDQHSSGTLDGYDCQVLVSIVSKTRKHLEMKHLIVKWIQHKLHKTASLFTWHSICLWPFLLDRTPIFIRQEFSSSKGAPPELEKSSISEKHSPQCPLFLAALTSMPLSDYLLMTSRGNEFEIVTKCSTWCNSPNTVRSQYTLCRLNRQMYVCFNSRH